MAQALLPGEKVLSQCVGMSGQSLVVTDQRVLIIKTGFMAGSTFGAKATTFDYRMISSVEVRTGPVTGAFSLSAGGGAQRDRSYWSQKGNDAYKSPDAIPIAKAPDFLRAAALIRQLAGRSHVATQHHGCGHRDNVDSSAGQARRVVRGDHPQLRVGGRRVGRRSYFDDASGLAAARLRVTDSGSCAGVGLDDRPCWLLSYRGRHGYVNSFAATSPIAAG